MEVKAERIADIIRKVDGNHNMGAGALSDAIMQELENDRPLSDLEIVQKALDKTGGRLTYHHSNGWAVEDESSDLYFRNSGSLLEWAKQTIGME